MPDKAPARLVTLKKRSEFLRIRGGARFGASAFLMEARPRALASCNPSVVVTQLDAAEEWPSTDEGHQATDVIGGARFGFTVTKKIGNAVVRNKVRRRLREALRLVAPQHAQSGCDYVLIARPAALSQQFGELCGDLTKAFQRIKVTLNGPPRRGKAKAR